MAEQKTTDLIYSLRRTLVPIVVGWLLARLARAGIDADPAELTALVTGAYYTVVRVLEARWPILGVAIGATRQPRYDQ